MRYTLAWRPLAFQLRCRPTRLLQHHRSQATSASGRDIKPPWEQIESCPPPTCPCSSTPEGLNIKKDGPMTIPPYSAHVIIKTARTDWSSKIEDDPPRGSWLWKSDPINPAKELKDLLGPGGKYHDVSSFPCF